jgi:hypothetical protein
MNVVCSPDDQTAKVCAEMSDRMRVGGFAHSLGTTAAWRTHHLILFLELHHDLLYLREVHLPHGA